MDYNLRNVSLVQCLAYSTYSIVKPVDFLVGYRKSTTLLIEPKTWQRPLRMVNGTFFRAWKITLLQWIKGSVTAQGLGIWRFQRFHRSCFLHTLLQIYI